MGRMKQPLLLAHFAEWANFHIPSLVQVSVSIFKSAFSEFGKIRVGTAGGIFEYEIDLN